MSAEIKVDKPLLEFCQIMNRCQLTAADEMSSSVLCNLTAWKMDPGFPKNKDITN